MEIPTPEPAPTTFVLSMKLFIDTKSQRVLFAEAGKDVVDFLFSLLALPIGAAVTLVKTHPAAQSMVGGVGNLHASVEKLGFTYGPQPVSTNDEIPRPAAASSPAASTATGGGCLLLMPKASFEPSRIFFRCSHNHPICHEGRIGSKGCGFYMTDVKGTRCPNCESQMTETLHYVSPAWPRCASEEEEVAAAEATYTVLDDLTIAPRAPMSDIASYIKLLGTMGVRDLAALKVTTVQLDYNKSLMILRASLHSKTVLTDAFVMEMTYSDLTNLIKG